MPQSTRWKCLPPCIHGNDQRHHVPVGAEVASHPTPLLRIFLSQTSHGAGCSILALPRFSSQCLIQDPAGSTRWTWEGKLMCIYPGPAPPAAWSCPRAGVLLGGWKLQLSALIRVLPADLGICACTCQRAALTGSSEQLLERGHSSHSVTCTARRVGDTVGSHSLCQESWEQEPQARAGMVGRHPPQRVGRGACAKDGARIPLRGLGEGPVPSMEQHSKGKRQATFRSGDVSALAQSEAAP